MVVADYQSASESYYESIEEFEDSEEKDEIEVSESNDEDVYESENENVNEIENEFEPCDQNAEIFMSDEDEDDVEIFMSDEDADTSEIFGTVYIYEPSDSNVDQQDDLSIEEDQEWFMNMNMTHEYTNLIEIHEYDESWRLSKPCTPITIDSIDEIKSFNTRELERLVRGVKICTKDFSPKKANEQSTKHGAMTSTFTRPNPTLPALAGEDLVQQ